MSRRETNLETVAEDALPSYSIRGSFNYRVMEAFEVLVNAISLRTRSFRGFGRFFGGSSNIIEANGIGEEITEMFHWISGDY